MTVASGAGSGFAFALRGARAFLGFFAFAPAAFFRFLSAFVGHSMLMQITQGFRPLMRTWTIGCPHASHRLSVRWMNPRCGSGNEFVQVG